MYLSRVRVLKVVQVNWIGNSFRKMVVSSAISNLGTDNYSEMESKMRL